MMTVVSKIWILIIAYGAFEAWTVYQAHDEEMMSLEQSIPQIEGQINRAKKEKSQIKSYLRDIEEAKKNIELVALEVEKLQKKLPETIKDAENLSLIKKIAEGLNIKKIFLSPGIEENKGFYITKRYEFTGTGTYLQFLVFFEKIGASERLLNIREVELKKSSEKQRGRFQLTNSKVIVEAYRYNPDHKEDRGINKIEASFKEKKPAPPAPKKKKKSKKKGGE
ncbi:MAG: type 4a pilus biogenesis protein PilO [Bacteriovoracaceae bacterium]|nr:type 4a pilus biogenesis protein PilO [Bacteriovoracaceae bacterium]